MLVEPSVNEHMWKNSALLSAEHIESRTVNSHLEESWTDRRSSA